MDIATDLQRGGAAGKGEELCRRRAEWLDAAQPCKLVSRLAGSRLQLSLSVRGPQPLGVV